jgi:hypothetical protein
MVREGGTGEIERGSCTWGMEKGLDGVLPSSSGNNRRREVGSTEDADCGGRIVSLESAPTSSSSSPSVGSRVG